jgi:hypothetical protein
MYENVNAASAVGAYMCTCVRGTSVRVRVNEERSDTLPASGACTDTRRSRKKALTISATCAADPNFVGYFSLSIYAFVDKVCLSPFER